MRDFLFTVALVLAVCLGGIIGAQLGELLAVTAGSIFAGGVVCALWWLLGKF